jgi:mRNA interferase HigB
VRILSKRRLREFSTRFPKAAEPLKRWANVVRSARWMNPALRADFGSADFVGDLTVHYVRQIVYIKQILTHEEYDEGEWKP